MSNGTPPIEPAPVPPSIAGIPQPVFGSGSPTLPAARPDHRHADHPAAADRPIPSAIPFSRPSARTPLPSLFPVGPLVGPAVGPAPVPPTIPGVQQPQFVPPGSATVPATPVPRLLHHHPALAADRVRQHLQDRQRAAAAAVDARPDPAADRLFVGPNHSAIAVAAASRQPRRPSTPCARWSPARP